MKQLNWWKSIASFLVVLFTMPLGHALMMIMDKTGTFRRTALLDGLDRISVPVLCYPLGYTAGDGEWRSCDSP